MEKTIFEKIIDREIPANIVYEDEHTLAFLDINPSNKGHTLVIPKRTARNILDITEEDFVCMARTARRVACAVKAATDADGVNITMNNEPAAGQEVFHPHMHIIPRFTGDSALGPMQHTSYEDGEIAAYATKIKNAIG